MTVPRRMDKKDMPPCLKIGGGELYVREATKEVYAKAAGMPIAFRHGMRAAVILSFGLQCIL